MKVGGDTRLQDYISLSSWGQGSFYIRPLSEAGDKELLALHPLLCFRIRLGVVNGRCVDSTFPL